MELARWNLCLKITPTAFFIPTQYIPACEKGFVSCLAKGPWMEYPVTGVKITINDGAAHSVDSSEMAFQATARGLFFRPISAPNPCCKNPS
ncbi:MAG: hypothetical protein R2861_03195 [Desulfobacterales bacterium]